MLTLKTLSCSFFFAGLIAVATLATGCSTGEPAAISTHTPALINEPGIVLTPAEGRVGARIDVIGSNWRPSDSVFVYLQYPSIFAAEPDNYGTVVAAGEVDAAGRFAAGFTFPTDPSWSQLSRAIVTAHSPSDGDAVSMEFRLIPPPTPASTSTSAPTATPLPATRTLTPAPTDAFPTPTALDISAAFQPFEHGFMIWRGDSRRVWVAVCCTSTDPLQGRWLTFNDSWIEGMPADDPSIVPPAKLYQPARGFGLIWRTGSVPSGETIRDLLGWAIAPEQGYTAHLEYHPGGFIDPAGHFNLRPGDFTINTPDGKQYAFHEAGPAWSLIQP